MPLPRPTLQCPHGRRMSIFFKRMVMKNPFLSRVLFFLGLAAALSFGACSDDDGTTPTDPTPPPATDKSLSVDKTEVSFDADGTQTQTFEITSEGVTWVVTPLDSWVTATPSSGRGNATITVTAEKNTTGAERTSGVDIAATDVNPVTVTVKQAAGEKVDPDPSATPMTLAEGYYLGATEDNVQLVQVMMTDMEVDSEGMLPPGNIYYLTLAVKGDSFETVDLTGDYTGSYDQISLTNPQAGDVVIALQEDNSILSYCFYEEYVPGSQEPVAEDTILKADVKIAGTAGAYTLNFTAQSKSGETLSGSYTGDIELYDVSTTPSYSTLTSDQTPRFVEAYGVHLPMDGYPYSLAVFTFSGEPTASPYEQLSVYVLMPTEDAEKGPEGVFSVSEIPEATGAIMPGDVEVNGQYYSAVSSWFVRGTIEGEYISIVEGSPIADGKMTVTKNGDQYQVEYTLYDDAETPHKISGTYTGPIEWEALSNDGNALRRLSRRAAPAMPGGSMSVKRFGPAVSVQTMEGRARLSSFL